jgi:hypothetical protein
MDKDRILNYYYPMFGPPGTGAAGICLYACSRKIFTRPGETGGPKFLYLSAKTVC